MSLHQQTEIDLSQIEFISRPFSRRRFLVGSSVFSAVAATGAVGCSDDHEVPTEYEAIGCDWPVLGHFSRVILPVEQNPKFVPFHKTSIFDNMNQIFASIPEPTRGDFSKGILLFNYAAIVLGFHLRPFTGLAGQDAVDYVRRWENGNRIQRGLVWALKQIVFVSYWQDPVTWPPIKYDGPITRVHGIPALGNAPLPGID